MRPIYQILPPLLSLFLVRVDLTDLYPLKLTVQILKVIDGDTVLVSAGSQKFPIRLLKLDAPEKKQTYLNQSESAGVFSHNCLRKLLNTSSYEASLYKIDIYGRVLGEVEDISFKMIQNGCAYLYPQTTFKSRSEKSLFLRAYQEARRNKLGLWGRGAVLSPKLWRAQKAKRRPAVAL